MGRRPPRAVRVLPVADGRRQLRSRPRDGRAAARCHPRPAGTTAKPAAPAWISQCTHYSGTTITRYGDKGLLVDGEVGPDTWGALRERT